MDRLQTRSQFICAKLTSLLGHSSRFVERCDGAPIQIALRIETPVSRNEDHRSKWSQIDRQLEEQGPIPAHSVEVPSLTKNIENGMKTVRCFRPAKRPVFAHASLRDEPASKNSFVIGELRYIEVGFDGVPLRLKHWVVHELRFNLIVFVTCLDQQEGETHHFLFTLVRNEDTTFDPQQYGANGRRTWWALYKSFKEMLGSNGLSDVESSLIRNFCDYLESEAIVSTYEIKDLLSYAAGLRARQGITSIFNQI